MHKSLSLTWKRRLARLMQVRFLQVLMVWGIYLFTPRHRIGVSVVVMDDQQRVLLLKHVFHPLAPWGLPGGWLERHEDPKVGALRELQEETGLTAVLEQILVSDYDPRPPHVGLVYLAKCGPGSIRLSDEILEAAWFDLRELPGPMPSGTTKALKAATAVLQQPSQTDIKEIA